MLISTRKRKCQMEMPRCKNTFIVKQIMKARNQCKINDKLQSSDDRNDGDFRFDHQAEGTRISPNIINSSHAKNHFIQFP